MATSIQLLEKQFNSKPLSPFLCSTIGVRSLFVLLLTTVINNRHGYNMIHPAFLANQTSPSLGCKATHFHVHIKVGDN